MARFLGLGTGSGTLDLSSYTIISASCSGTAAASTLAATNASFAAGQRIFIYQVRGTGVGNYEDNIIDSYVAGTISLKYPLENTYTDSAASQAQVVVVPEAGTSTGTLTVPSWDGDTGGLFVMSLSATANGTITGDGAGYRGGTFIGAAKPGYQGEGTAGAGVTQSNSNNGNGGAGGGDGTGTLNSGGGGGGHAAAGSDGTGDGSGPGGDAVGTASMSSGIFMGGGGGTGGDGTSIGAGGDGGAIVIVYANTLAGTLSISVDGANGAAGGVGAGGGGGAGGSILLKCTTNSGATLSATKGTGGSGSTGTGGDGSVGRIRIEACNNTTGTEDPAASNSVGGHSYCSLLGGMI